MGADGAASTESSLFELCRVVTEVDDHQCASCFAETEKPLLKIVVIVKFIVAVIIENMVFPPKAGFFFQGIGTPVRESDVRGRLSGSLLTSRLDITAMKL